MLREVVAGWDEIKLHASMKFGNRVETNVGWEGRTVAPAGLQAMVDDVREAFAAGTMRLSADDTNPDEEDEDEEDVEVVDAVLAATEAAPEVAATAIPLAAAAAAMGGYIRSMWTSQTVGGTRR